MTGTDYVQVRKKHIGNTGECSGEATVKTVGWGWICMAGSRLCTVQVRRKHTGNTGECSGEAAIKTVVLGGVCIAGSRLCTGKEEAHRKHRRGFW